MMPWRQRIVAIAPAAALLAAGCQNGKLPSLRQLLDKPSPKQQMMQALTDPDADHRREAVVALSRSDELTRDWALDGLDIVARLDESPQVRCVAIRALARTGLPRVMPGLLMILNHRDFRGRVRTPSAPVRVDATRALADLLGLCVATSQPATRPATIHDSLETFCRLLLNDPHRDVRQSAAVALGDLPDRRSLEALIAALTDEDFGVVYRAEQSLIALTGRTFEHDPDAWRDWIEATPDPFARRGQIPPGLIPPSPGRWQAFRRNLREWFGMRPEPSTP